MRIRAKKPARSKKPAAFARYVDRAARAARTMSTRTMWIIVCGVLGAAVLIGAATSTPGPDQAAAHAAQKPATAAAAATVTGASAEPVVPAAAPTAADVATSAKAAPMTTITGCLEREDAAYRLKETAGEDVPKARSWKTGFIKKASASVDLYDTTNHAKLPAHVGQRVSVTGELVNREMYVRSLQRVAASCSTKS